MSYCVDRSIGYRPWGVTNPWVWANLAQPQRLRGNVSPMVFQTRGPFLQSAHLGQTETETELLRRAAADLKRGERMEKLAMTGVALSAVGLLLTWSYYRKQLNPNRRRRRRRRRR